MNGIDFQANWLRKLATPTVYELLFEGLLQGVGCIPACLCAYLDHPLDMVLVGLIR